MAHRQRETLKVGKRTACAVSLLVLHNSCFVSRALQIFESPPLGRLSTLQPSAASGATCSSAASRAQHLGRVDRRQFGKIAIAVIGGSSAQHICQTTSVAVAHAEDVETATTAPDLASSLFNPDGSLKEGVESEAKFRTVSFGWLDEAASDSQLVRNDDGVNGASTPNGDDVRLSYRLPVKWAAGTPGGDEIYFDRTEGVNAKACRRITVFRPPGVGLTESILEKASTAGIAQSLGVPEDLTLLQSADLISGRIAARDGQRYFEFDLAVAPKTCGVSNEDLGLGFCPYDTIYLLSATIRNGRLYAMAIESDKAEWRRANSDLKLVRSSFTVQ